MDLEVRLKGGVSPPVWRAALLGRFEIASPDVPMARLRSKSSRALFAYLALHPGREFSRSDIAALFWPDSDGDRQNQNLRKALSDLRQVLEEEREGSIFATKREHIGVHDKAIVTDVSDFRSSLNEAHSELDPTKQIRLLEEAVSEYGGGLLPTQYEPCFVPLRFELEEQFARAVCELSASYGKERAHDAIELGLSAVQKAPLRDDIVIALMRAYVAADLPAEAVRQYEELERVLDEQLGESPSAAATAEFEKIPRAKRVQRESAKTQTPNTIILGAAAEPDIAHQIGDLLRERGTTFWTDVARDDRGTIRKRIAQNVTETDCILFIVSQANIESEMLTAMGEWALESYFKNFSPLVVPIVVGNLDLSKFALGRILSQVGVEYLNKLEDDSTQLREIIELATSPGKREVSLPELELSGGAVPVESRFYIERKADSEFEKCLTRKDGVVLVKGPRQIGKTSLIARGLVRARSNGFCTALCDFQTVSTSQLSNDNGSYRAIAYKLAKDLGVEFDWQNNWRDWLGPNDNLEDAVEQIISKVDRPVLWVMDEVDRLFGQAYTNDFFGLLRGWYNRRALEPDSVWGRLTISITYATEAHLFITDLNQSPFNVGVRLDLEDFSLEQIGELNKRYGAPLTSQEEVEHLWELTGGHPYLSRKALDWIVSHKSAVTDLEEIAIRDDSPFADHLRRLAVVLNKDKELKVAALSIARGKPELDTMLLLRLRAGGVLADAAELRFRVPFYRQFLASA